jgi:hypothetical protein
MRRAVVSIVIALAFAPQAFAVFRPLFPVKPEPPFSTEAILVLESPANNHRLVWALRTVISVERSDE